MRLRTAPAVAAAVLGLAVAAPVAALADSPASPTPVVTQAASTFTVDLPGVGSLTFTVDPATGSVSGLVATADSGFTAGTPSVTDEGVQVSFTDASGAPTVLQAEVERENGVVKVKPEAEDGAGPEAAASAADPSGDNENESVADDGNGASEDQASPAATGAGQPTAQSDDTQANETEHHGTDNGGAPAQTTTTTTTATQSAISGSSDGEGGGDGGSSSSGGHDGGSGSDGSGGQDSSGTSGGGD